jgi:hypothetical protein
MSWTRRKQRLCAKSRQHRRCELCHRLSSHDAARLISGETLYVDGGYQSCPNAAQARRSVSLQGTIFGGRTTVLRQQLLAHGPVT